MKRAELRSRTAEIGYFTLAFLADVLFKGLALHVVALVLFPPMKLVPPALHWFVIAVIAYQGYRYMGNAFSNRLVKHAMTEHRHRSPRNYPEGVPLAEGTYVRVVMEPPGSSDGHHGTEPDQPPASAGTGRPTKG